MIYGMQPGYGQNFNPNYNSSDFYSRTQQFNPNPQPQFIVKQVSNIEEAKASIVDPLSTYLFVDYNTGKIYMKRMNNNGLSDFYTFSAERETGTVKTSDPLSEINQRLINIENKIGGINNVQSVSNNAVNEKSDSINATAGNAENARTESSAV